MLIEFDSVNLVSLFNCKCALSHQLDKNLKAINKTKSKSANDQVGKSAAAVATLIKRANLAITVFLCN